MSDVSLLVLCLASTLGINLLGFRRTVWFVSIGYTFSVAIGTILVAALASRLWLHNGLQLAILFVWAARLGYFLVQRDRNERYRQAVDDQTGRAQALPLSAKLGIWISTSVLYVTMLSPAVLSLAPLDPASVIGPAIVYLGIVVMIAGVVIESIADRQKTRFKREHPGRFTNIGLYRWVRCPNYLGEILVWFGSYVVGLVFYAAWWHWVLAGVGLICIVLIMIGSTKRLERKHEERYGHDERFREYCRSVPVLFPWVPIYTLRNVRVYLE
jgi:steroid 5-alpha reductase family enzyme